MLARRVLRLSTTWQYAAARVPLGTRFYSPDQKGDVLDQSRQSGFKAKHTQNSSPIDAANPESGKKAARGNLSGNQEGVGFVDQVGSQSASGSNMTSFKLGKPESSEGLTGEENITPPSFIDAVKSKLGFKTTAGEDKQNRGGGKGVTGTGQMTFDKGKRTMHTSAMWQMPAKTTGQAPPASRQPKDKTHADQNAHLKHKDIASTPDHGKGNAAEDPKLPSHQVNASVRKSKDHGKRTLHTSARVLGEKGGSEHTAESYFKDVDETKPVNPKVHQVDSSNNSGAPVARANEQPATGSFSRAGPDTKEYETASKHDQPYDTPPTRGPEADEKLRYGGEPGLSSPSKPDEGPSGRNAGGRKPEGRS